MDHKVVKTLLVMGLLAIPSMAYNSSLIDPRQNLSSSDFTSAFPDVLVKTINENIGGFGNQIGLYFLIILFAIMVYYIISWLKIRRGITG